MPMTVKERDQYENLKADWPNYDCGYDSALIRPRRRSACGRKTVANWKSLTSPWSRAGDRPPG
jgi:hypothetical protein